MAFKFTRAICREIPRSLVAEAQRMDSNNPSVDYENALRQHKSYVDALKRLNIDVTILKADESLPDCVFVEDIAVVCGDIALLTRTGHESRRKEISAMRSCLIDHGYTPIEMTEPGHLDGGDVLFTGTEFFVGLSKRSDVEGIKQLSDAFPKYQVHTIEVEKALHLKSVVTMAGQDLIVIADGFENTEKAIREKGNTEYTFIHVPDVQASNCVYANDTLIIRSKEEFPKSISVFNTELKTDKIELTANELAKVDGALTCYSLLLM